MELIAGILVIVFAVVHGSTVLPWLTQPRDPAAPPEQLVLRVPLWARWAWALAAAMAAVGGVLLGFGAYAGLILAGLGLLDLCCLAVMNGFWMKGRPTLSHHIVRIAVALAIFGLAVYAI